MNYHPRGSQVRAGVFLPCGYPGKRARMTENDRIRGLNKGIINNFFKKIRFRVTNL